MTKSVFEKIARKATSWKEDRKRQNQKKQMTEFYSALIKGGDLCFDIGANKGSRTEVFAALGAKVVAIEPLPVCCDVLEMKFGNADHVTIVQKAVSSKKGTEIIYAASATAISTMNLEWQKAVRESGRFSEYLWNEAITMDDLIVDFGIPSYCKIDVEGHEHSVFLGLSSPIGLLAFEFTPEMIGEAKKCLARISELGKYEYNLALGESMKFHLADWESVDRLIQRLTEISNGSEGYKTFGDVYARLIS